MLCLPRKLSDGHVPCMFRGNRHLPLADIRFDVWSGVVVGVDEMWTGAFSGHLKNKKFDLLAKGWLV